MSPLDKARRAVEVRKQYEQAVDAEDRIEVSRLARMLEQVSRKEKVAAIPTTSS